MLGSVHIQNFRCVRDARFTLSPLTVFVGPNASGKSTLIRALDPGITLQTTDVWQHRKDSPVRFTITLTNGNTFDVRLGEGQTLKQQGSPYSYRLLRLDLDALRRPNQVRSESQLMSNGGNLTNVFDTLSRSRQIELAKELSNLVSVISDVEARPTGGDGGYNSLYFQDKWKRDVWYDPYQMSDGTILLLAFLVCQYQDSPPDVLAIEEPERGLHPYLLGELVTILRRLTKGELGGKSAQVLLATHSAELLDHLKPEEVRFLSRISKDGGTEIQSAPTSSPEWERAIQEYRNSLGEAWLSGGLGAVPGR